MSDFSRILLVVCGSSLACMLVLVLLSISLLRLAGRPGWGTLLGLAPLVLSLFGGLFSRRGQDASEDEPDYVTPGRSRPSAEALRSKAQSVDFESLVAQNLNQPPAFNAQAAPPGQAIVPPAVPGVPLKTGSPPANIPTAPLVPPHPTTSGTPITNVPPAAPPSDIGRLSGARPETAGYPTQFGTEPGRPAAPLPPATNPEDVLGPLNKPSLRNRPGQADTGKRRPNRDNAAEDELFGGLLDGDGDGFIDN